MQPRIPAASLPIDRLIAAVITQSNAVALMVPGADRWRVDPEATFLPLELPSAPLGEGQDASEALNWLGERLFGQALCAVACSTTYGATAAHAIDRVAYTGTGAPQPFIVVERIVPEREGDGHSLRRLIIEQVRAVPSAAPLRLTAAHAALLWLPLPALRRVVRGLPLRDLLGLDGVSVQSSGDEWLDPDAVVYLPSECGERYLLRVTAKYGDAILYQGGTDGT